MNLRKHQKETDAVTDAIIAGGSIKKTVVKATPGAGKSLLPVIAGKLIGAGLADAIAWIVPRLSLASQAEAVFLDPVFRSALNHRMAIRSSTNDQFPCRGLSGFVSTYQALAVDEARTVLNDFKRRRYILVLDEPHHIEKGGQWEESIAPLVENSAFQLLMSGTMARGNGNPIAFIDYEQSGQGYAPVERSTETTAFIKYDRSDALYERAILPLVFYCHDGSAKWMTNTGMEVEYESIAKVSRKDAGAAIYTAVSTKYADELLDEGTTHWKKTRRYINPYSKALIVTASVNHAKQAVESLRRMGIKAPIATSRESLAAQKEIKRFRTRNDSNILVAVNMVYEGLDVPAATHVISLTHIRSVPWIEQMVARAVRIDPNAGPYESQAGHIFCPDDPLFRAIIKQIETEQAQAIDSIAGRAPGEKAEPLQLSLFDDGFGSQAPGGIIPLESRITGSLNREIGFNVTYQQPIITESEREESLRKQIDRHIKQFAAANGCTPRSINILILKRFERPREQMTRPELERLMAYLQRHYRIDFHRVAQSRAVAI